ncbi:MAG: GGDEF domain-containing protein [Alphaproteobacteria bacterium]|nr:GGDEF domain-containing protein [Alphaproteobacteria bacterium]
MRTDNINDTASVLASGLPGLTTQNARTAPGGKWLNAADEVFAYFQGQKEPQNFDQRNTLDHAAILELLKSASQIIRRSEETIARQESRITALENVATTDELTQIKNRRGFMEAFERELDRVNRGMSEGGLVILIDLDNFKPINDIYGHPAGDAALKLVASTLAADIRRMDVAGRLGGDEFVLLFANTTRAKVAARVQKLVWMLNNLSLIWYGTEIPVRASLGIKEFTKGDTADRIFSAADVSLYDNKRRRKATEAITAAE